MRQVDLDHAQSNFLGELSGTKRLAGELDSALRLAAARAISRAKTEAVIPARSLKAGPRFNPPVYS
jgi:hypothetical protein